MGKRAGLPLVKLLGGKVRAAFPLYARASALELPDLEDQTEILRIQEQNVLSPAAREVFPGAPEIRGGYMYANHQPGLGIDIDEKLAARFPYKTPVGSRGNDRRPDGTIVRPQPLATCHRRHLSAQRCFAEYKGTSRQLYMKQLLSVRKGRFPIRVKWWVGLFDRYW